MIKNNNKKIIGKLTLRNLKSGKMRNIFIILTVALSVTLLSGIALYTAGAQQVVNIILNKMQHVIYMRTSPDQIEQIRNDERTEDILIYKRGSSIEIENFIIIPQYIAMNSKIISTIEIVEGYYPKESNEIVVEKAYMNKIGKTSVLGEILTFTWLDGTTEEFVISGFLDSIATSNIFGLYFSEDYALNGSQLKDVPFSSAIRIFGAENMSKDGFLDEIRGMGAEYGIERPDINENNAFVNKLGVSITESLVIIGIGIAILFVSVLVIYSIFYISVTGRIRQFGQLRTIGMTSKQIKKMINLEGLLLCLMGSQIGLLIGGTFAYFIEPDGFTWMNTLVIGIIVIIADLITVLFSIRKPAKIAASASPIDMSKVSGYTVNVKKSKLKKRRLNPTGLAKISNDRNRKKSTMTMLSLGIGGIVFIAGATMLTSMNEEEFSRQSEYRFGEYVLYISGNAI